MDGECSA